MSQAYQPGQSVSINPSLYNTSDQQQFSGEFAALVQVVKSRYVKLTYPPELGYTDKIAIELTLLSTKGNNFTKTYSTGLKWDDQATISPDGSRLISKSPDFAGFKSSSDGMYLLRKAISSGFPAEALTDNIAVFEGHCFFLTTDVNPAWKGSSKKPYPKQYHPEGFEAAKAAREAARAAKQGQQNAEQVNTYTVPPVVVSSDTSSEAGMVLGQILAMAGGSITRTQIPTKINEIATEKGWSPKQRQDITLALWDLNTLSTIAAQTGIKLDGETLTLA